MKERYVKAHMQSAIVYSKLSYDATIKVGCVIVKNDRLISIGFNGTPPGWDNTCEQEDGHTKPEVIHAEANAIAKLARSTDSGEGASLFCTLAPCVECAKMIVQAGITEVYYIEMHPKSVRGVEFLEKCGLELHQLPFEK